MEKLLILDGNSLMNRAFYAVPPLSTQEGIHTNAVLGFTNMLLKMQEDIKPDYIVSTFDRKAPTFRHLEYKEYKAGRKVMPNELREQFPIIKELLSLMSITIFEMDGFEADDLIGTVAKECEKNNIEVYIVTGDKDALQLASKNIKVVLTKKGVSETDVYDEEKMKEEYGITPTQFIDAKGLMGDTSDNIPGVPGVGPKTAYKLIREYGTVEEVLRHIDDISGKKLKENLTDYSEQAIFSKRLATIKTDVPLEFSLDEIKSSDNFDLKKLRKLFFKLNFKKLLTVFSEEEKEELPLEYVKVESLDDLNDLEKEIKDCFCFTCELENPNIFSKLKIKNIFLEAGDKNYIIPFEKFENSQEFIQTIKSLFENQSIRKISHDVKSTITAFRKQNININNLIFDTAIGAYLVDSSRGKYLLIDVINQYLQIEVKGDGEELQVKMTSYLSKLYEILNKKIKDDEMEELLFEVELPLEKVLSSMESLGFNINKDKLYELREKFQKEIKETQEEIYSLSEEKFNINSPKQLGVILFDKLDLPVIKRTKTGYSTNAEVLEKLKDKHPIINKITFFRQLSKLYSTYVEGLLAVIDEDGCIHSNFNQTVTTTGRLSSTEPNLQNIPIKYEMGREIRKIFIPRNEGDVILSADYSQIELRVLADIAYDKNMIDAFKHHSDIHTKTASEVFKVPIDEVTSTMRSSAKAVNFGIVYGISDFSLAEDLKITKKEAKEYMEIYLERYPNIKKYLHEILEDAKEKGYVKTIMNRRRFIPEINASNKIVKAFGERLAMNAPIQGSAADIIKIAMVKVYEELKVRNLKSEIILQVHDELILNVPKEELEEVKILVKEKMENVIILNVPLEVDINIGDTWYDAK